MAKGSGGSLHFNAIEHFWKVFPAQLFVNSDVVSKKAVKDLLKAKGIYNLEGGKNGPEEYKEILMQKLNNVSEKTINKRMEIQPGHNIQYTPLSIALRYGELDIAEHYLGCFANSLDVTVINTHGSTALSEALSRYKVYLFSGREDQETKRFKRIIIELIERSPMDSLYAKTVRRHISVLEEAINTFDIEIVRATVEKKGFDIQNLIISSDDFSPLYYVINRCYILSKAISKGKIAIPDNANINWAKANFPGIFIEDKMDYHENIKSYPLFNNIDIAKLISYEKFGKPEIWEQEFMKLKEIVKYLIDRTDDVDKFVKKYPDGDRTTALSLAVESDFDDICRLLIAKGANPVRIFGNNGIPHDSPFIRAACFKSWKTLEMLLTDFGDQIKTIINDRYREDRHTTAHLLFRLDYGPLYQYSVNNENIELIKHFIPLFHSAGANFDIPDKSGITVKQILSGYNLEGL
jgi:ankyrin repeat protein